MHIVAEREDTVAMLLRGEACTFLVEGGRRTLVADGRTGPLLVAARADASGNLWLGSWRRAPANAGERGVRLGEPALYADGFCRRLAAMQDPRVFRAHCALCGPALLDGEIAVSGKGLPVVVAPRRWTKPRSPKSRERRASA